MILETLSIGGVVVWAGAGNRVHHRLVTLARLVVKNPLVSQVLERFGIRPRDEDHRAWHEITHTRLTDGRPFVRTVYRVSQTGRIEPCAETDGG
jgi:hypothetical protein